MKHTYQQASHKSRMAGWAQFYLPDRASLKKALFGPVSTAPAAEPTAPATRTLRRGTEGQALVEFALTLPFLIILFVVLVELGLLIRSHMTITSAVREGVRAVSSRGNADPSVLTSGGNEVNARVGVDGDLLLTQNVNTALQQERANVVLLMTYRADTTEITSTGRLTDPVTNQSIAPTSNIGIYGLGGQYGVYYNTALSTYPFQEIFDYNVINGEKWFSPTVMSVTKCASQYGSSEPADPAAKTPSGVQYTGVAFCGDASNANGVTATGGITRTLPLGSGTSPSTAGNASAIVGKARGPSLTNCALIGGTGTNKNDVLYSNAIQCWRYNFAPWYPALRYSLDFTGNDVNINPSSVAYFNYQAETAATFGSASYYRSPDYAGVQIVYTHKWLLSFFPGQLTLTDKAVKIMEPVGGGFNKPGS